MTMILYDDVCLNHLAGVMHPECPARLEAVVRALREAGLWDGADHPGPRDATLDELRLVHTPEYIEEVRRLTREGGAFDIDTPVTRGSWAAAMRAVGLALEGVDAVIDGRAGNAFAAIRPPGHHALADRAMGFCLFNNVAIAARYAQRTHGLGRVLILDWDIHHGNGTQAIFYDDPSVLYISTHALPFYPGTGAMDERGEGAGLGTTINLPMPRDASPEQIVGVVQRALEGPGRAFDPDLVLISAGFDAGATDPLGCFHLEPEDFATLTRLAMDLADGCCGGRLLSVLEGGYHLGRLGVLTAAHVHTLMGGTP